MAKAAKSENIKVAVRVRPFISFVAALNSEGSINAIMQYNQQKFFSRVAFCCRDMLKKI